MEMSWQSQMSEVGLDWVRGNEEEVESDRRSEVEARSWKTQVEVGLEVQPRY